MLLDLLWLLVRPGLVGAMKSQNEKMLFCVACVLVASRIHVYSANYSGNTFAHINIIHYPDWSYHGLRWFCMAMFDVILPKTCKFDSIQDLENTDSSFQFILFPSLLLGLHSISVLILYLLFTQ